MRKNAKLKRSLSTIVEEHLKNTKEDKLLTPENLAELERLKLADPVFIDGVRDAILFASAPLTKQDIHNIDRDLGAVVNAASRLLESIGNERDRFRLPGMYKHLTFVEDLELFIEDMSDRLKKAKAKAKENEEIVGSTSWKTRITLELLADRFREHGEQPTTSIEGDFERTAEIVLERADHINPGCVNKAARRTIRKILKAR